MNDDLNNKIDQIAQMLGQDTVPDNIKSLISLLASSAGQNGQTEAPPKTEELPLGKDEKNSRSELDENLEMVRKIKKVMDRMSSTSDPRVNLLTAVKPFLNNTRQKRITNCIKILMMSNMARFIDDFEKGI